MDLQSSRRSWLYAVALAVFDLDTGQKTEACVPEGQLSHQELQSIAYGAFPVTTPGPFRKQRSHPKIAVLQFLYVQNTPYSPPHFRNRRQVSLLCRDDRLHRGADQRSVVIVSEYPYTSILSPLVAILGPALFPAFRSAAAEVMHACNNLWPLPIPGKLAHLTIGPHRVTGLVPLDTCIPDATSFPLLPQAGTELSDLPPPSCLPMCGAFCEPLDNLEVLLVHSKNLWKLWEVMLMAHPVMVFSCSAEHSSAAVCALVSLISPLPYSQDYRPLLSIHDPAAQLFGVCDIAIVFVFPSSPVRSMPEEREPGKQGQAPPTLVGVTNPYFLRAFSHCPNVMTIMHEPSALTPMSDADDTQQFANIQPGMLSTLFTASGSFHPDLLAGKLDSLTLQRGLLCTGQDRAVIHKIKASMDSPSASTVVAACQALRIHFHHLTASFLLPFFDFLDRPCPWVANRKAESLAGAKLHADGFNVNGFHDFLERYPIPDQVVNIAGNKRKAQSLYHTFMDSINFKLWMTRLTS